MKIKYALACLLACTLLTGCVSRTVYGEEAAITPLPREKLFTARDEEGDWTKREYVSIALENQSLSITEGGVYILSGVIKNGQIVVDTPKDEKVQLVLSGVSVHCENHAALYVKQADKVFITLAEGTENTLSCGENFIQTDENNVDAALFSKEDVTLNGSGSLTLLSPGGHGVVSKDELTVTFGTYHITAAAHGMTGQDNIAIKAGDFRITAGKDGLHAEHDEDEALGFLYIENGTFHITAQQDGLSSSGQMEIAGGEFTLLCGGGSAQGEAHTGGFGGFGGTPPGGFGGRGGKGGFGGGTPPEGFGGSTPPDSMEPFEQDGNTASSAQTTSDSKKGLKAGGHLLLTGGTFHIDAADDAIHSNASIRLDDGTFTIQTGDDGFHADEKLTVNGGSITITESYEGLEGLHILITGGNITLTASDDGLNAAGGTDESGYTGFGGGRDRFGRGGFGGFGGMSAGNGSIVIQGGTLSITAHGDGIDANGSLQIDDGFITVTGPTQGDTATLDYDTTGEINGGTFIGTGATGLAQAFSGGSQGTIAVQVGNIPAGTEIRLENAAGQTILTYTPVLDYRLVILSTPEIIPGESYTLYVGTASGTFTAN